MKKILILLLAAALLCANALALNGRGYPVWDGGFVPANTLCGTLDGENLSLAFDPSAEFSMSFDHYLQVCFYAMSVTGENYIEIYLVLPQNAQSGDVITPDYAVRNGLKECSVSFYEVIRNNEDFYVAMQDSAAYPETSSYEIRVDSFTETEAAYVVRGTLSAALVQMRELAPTGKILNLTGVSFDFTLPKANVGSMPLPSPSAEPTPEQPFAGDDSDSIFEFFADDATPAPDASSEAPYAPPFTLPPDYARI